MWWGVWCRRLKSLSRSNGTGEAAQQAWQILSVDMLGPGGVSPDLIALNTALHALAKVHTDIGTYNRPMLSGLCSLEQASQATLCG